jgi:mRNA-degrading endonuclease RelE of RelBE toxin-antitoxin system
VGDLIRASGGLRKVRWNIRAFGKRGGIRVIYYWHNKDNLIFLLLMYRKNIIENLSPLNTQNTQKRV